MELNHVGLTVTDMERSMDFYCGVAGMHLERRGFKTGGEWFDTLTGSSGAVIDAVRLALDGFQLQLVQYHSGGGEAVAAGHHRVGNVHLCISVADVEAQRAAVLAHDGLEATPIVDVAGGPARSFYTADPDGTPVEFIQLRP
jgi:catechol 2,3-dioxygenase-like lactoylglutathione lyase family enzyme